MGFAFFGLGKWDLLHWDWDLITGNGMGNFKNGMGNFKNGMDFSSLVVSEQL